MSDKQLDLMNRDPQDINNYLQVEFDDVLAEPEGTHSADCVWKNSHKCFTCGKNLCYKIMTYLCGLCLALAWGCIFAEISFSIVWFFTPCFRALHIIMNPIKKLYSIFFSTFVGPMFETMGLVFSRIHVTNSQGTPPKPIGSV